MRSVRTVALASGRGSNFRAVLDAKIPECNFVGLITDRPGTGAANIAREHDIDVIVIDFKEIGDRDKFSDKLLHELQRLAPDLILGLGFMRILDETTVRIFNGQIMNIHPSLLPAFPGMNAQKQAFEYGAKVSGCTVHFMDEGVDTGPIVAQKAIDIGDAQDADEVARRILEIEHELIVESVRLFCEGRLRIEGRRVISKDEGQ